MFMLFYVMLAIISYIKINSNFTYLLIYLCTI